MGFDKLITFLNKNLPNIGEEVLTPSIIANHIFIDMNFLIYNSIYELEEEINKIIMIILGVTFTDIDIINEKLNNIFSKDHWIKLNLNMDEIIDGSTIEEIILKFNKILNENINRLLCYHLFNSIYNHISIHPLQFIKTINIFVDGIPTYSKILEQRRRRMKNYLDSKKRKEFFNEYFKNILNSIITEDNISFDYFDWVKNMYSFDKGIGPYSKILNDIVIFINNQMINTFKNIKININNSLNYGESDYKIFKYIIDKKMDCDIAIHSCDSDFIFLILWYQMLSISKYNDTNIMFINYNNLKSSIKTLYYGKKIINNLINKYALINNINEEISINVIYDFLSLLILFENDIMPSSYELGTELSLKLIFETHYDLYINLNFVINLNNINVINFNNLSKWLLNIKQSNSFSTIIVNRFYKTSNNHEIKLDNMLNLQSYDKGFYIEKNSFQSLYNYIVYKSENSNENIFKNIESIDECYNKYIKLVENYNIEQYVNLYISLNHIFFNDFNLYTPYNTLYYNDNIAPSIDMIINFIKSNDMITIQEKCFNNFKLFNSNNYFNPISHHLFITPYLLENDIYTSFNLDIDEKYIKSFLNVIGTNIKGIWYEEGCDFNIKNINPYIFINLCNKMIKFYKNTFINKLYVDNNLLEINTN